MPKTKAILLFHQPNSELGELLRAAGGEVCGEIIQRLAEPDPQFFLSSGKLAEMRSYQEANTVLVDGDLSARQARNLLRETGLQPLDRTTLVLDIFALRARTHRSMLQVEAAQLQHLRGQLRGMWPHLERTGGGIGTRGPGETQLESDRRMLEKRIRDLRRRLQDLQAEEKSQRKERLRSGMIRVALWGYTNSGKSTLAHLLGAKGSLPSEKVFATLDPQTRRVHTHLHTFLLTDTVGIIDRMPEEILEAFHSTIEESRDCDLLLHTLSGSRWQEELRTGEELLERLNMIHKPRILVINGEAEDPLPRDCVHINGHDVSPLIRALEKDYRQRSREESLLFPYDQGRKLSELYQTSSVLEREDRASGVKIRALILPERMHLFQSFLASR